MDPQSSTRFTDFVISDFGRFRVRPSKCRVNFKDSTSLARETQMFKHIHESVELFKKSKSSDVWFSRIFLFDKDAKKIHWRKKSLFNRRSWDNQSSIWKR